MQKKSIVILKVNARSELRNGTQHQNILPPPFSLPKFRFGQRGEMDFGTPSNDTYGRGLQNVEGYYTEVNRRTNPKAEFNNIDRAWRSEYLKSMKLTSSDAVRTDLELTNPDYYKARYNIFRRIYRAPGHFIHKNILNKMVSPDMAYRIRGFSAVFAGMVMFGWVSMHYALYRGNNWASVS